MYTLAIIALLFPLVLMLFVLPRMAGSRRGIVFGVTLPLDFAESSTVKTARTRYRNSMMLIATVAIVLVATLFWLQHPNTAALVSSLAVPMEIAAAFFLRTQEAKRLRAHAVVVPLERSADLAPGSPTTALQFAVAALLPLGFTAGYLHLHWADIPTRWPQHWDFSGVPNGWGTRSVAGVYTPLGFAALMLLLLAGVIAFQSFAPGPEVRQRRRVLAPLAALSWVMSLLFCGTALLPLFPLSSAATAAVLLVPIVLTLAIVVWIVARIAQQQSQTATATPYDGTPDTGWRWSGEIYYNPADPALLVPKRFGMGWTLNFGHPSAWWFLGGILVIVLGAAAAPLLLRMHAR